MWKAVFLFLFAIPLMAEPVAQSNVNPAMVSKLAVLAALSLLPFAVMLLTSFLKIVFCLTLLRSSIGTPQTPPNQVLNGMALLLTIYVMFPTGLAMYKAAEGVIQKAPPSAVLSDQSSLFVIEVIDKAKEPLRQFLQRNTRSNHMQQFYNLGVKVFPEPYKTSVKKTDLIILIPSYVTTQLQTGFIIGVFLYLPFFMIDLIVSNILLAMGMMMLSPMTIALPIKLLLLVIVDGWTQLVQTLVLSFR